MANFIDRRLNPKGKSLSNRQRFLHKERRYVQQTVKQAIQDKPLTDIASENEVVIKREDISEPSFRHAATGGMRDKIYPGNKTFKAGDKIRKPPSGSGGGGGKEGINNGEGEDVFTFILTREEFLDCLFEDLALPDLVKKSLKEIKTTKLRRAGFKTSGIQANLDILRTMRLAKGRHLAFGGRPKQKEINDLEQAIEDLQNKERTCEEDKLLKKSIDDLDEMVKRRKRVMFVDSIDIRYRNFEPRPEPTAQAVMFCLMDVSASMGEREKDLAKRFFLLLYLFLERHYEKIELVFIRHTHEADEVDEETFFYSPKTGGTVVSTALTRMKEVIDNRYPPKEWNIYAAQASDGENFSGDSQLCSALLREALLPICQHFAYIEIMDEAESGLITSHDNGMELWRHYFSVKEKYPNLAMERIGQQEDIFPVFRRLFEKKPDRAVEAA